MDISGNMKKIIGDNMWQWLFAGALVVIVLIVIAYFKELS